MFCNGGGGGGRLSVCCVCWALLCALPQLGLVGLRMEVQQGFIMYCTETIYQGTTELVHPKQSSLLAVV